MSAAGDSRRRLLRWVMPVLAAVLLGLILGRATASSSPAPNSGRAPAPSPGGARPVAGVPVSFPKTATGAAAAIAAYQQSFADPAILRPGMLRARVAAVATPDYAARMLATNAPGVERLAAGPIGVGVGHGLRTIYTAVPIGYRVLSFGSGRAKVETWGLTLIGNAGSVEPAAYFGIGRTEVIWSGDRWRIAETKAGFGPTPRLGTEPGPLGGYDVLDLAKGLRSYALAP